jgi:hypothetical protein
VDFTGLVKAVAPGTAYIIVEDAAKDKYDECLVTVLPLTPETPQYTLELNTSTLALVQGERATLQIVVTPPQTGLMPQWASSNPSVADVSSNGTVIALSPGVSLIRVTLGAVSANCIVTVNAALTEPIVSQIEDESALLTFPRTADATYYLIHIYELKAGEFKPFRTLKTTPDGTVTTLRALAGNNLLVPLLNLSPGLSYALQIESIRETNGKTEVIQRRTAAFATTGIPVGLFAPEGGSRVSYASGALLLENLEGSDCILTTLSGQTAARFRVSSAVERLRISLPAGMYILSASKGDGRTVFKFVVR